MTDKKIFPSHGSFVVSSATTSCTSPFASFKVMETL